MGQLGYNLYQMWDTIRFALCGLFWTYIVDENTLSKNFWKSFQKKFVQKLLKVTEKNFEALFIKVASMYF